MSQGSVTRGRLFAVVGPSGAGKDTLIEAARAARPDLAVARRVITRPTEAGGEPFEGVTGAEFDRRTAEGAFVVTWAAHGLRYGIPAAEIAPLQAGRDVVFNGSRQALPRIREAVGDVTVILVTAPEAVIAARLSARGRETEAEIARRLERGTFAVPEGFPVVPVMNDGSLAEGVARFLQALQPVSA